MVEREGERERESVCLCVRRARYNNTKQRANNVPAGHSFTFHVYSIYSVGSRATAHVISEQNENMYSGIRAHISRAHHISDCGAMLTDRSHSHLAFWFSIRSHRLC